MTLRRVDVAPAFLQSLSDTVRRISGAGRHDWPSGCLDDMLTETLLTNKVDFFNLLVLNVVFLKDYLNVRRLRLLYNLAVRRGVRLLRGCLVH